MFCCGVGVTIGGVSQGREVDHRIGGKVRDFGPDEVIAGVAGRQHGVVARAQLVAAGIGARAIELRVGSGRLHPLYRGVYAVGHYVVSQRGRWMAATLATGGVISHRPAGPCGGCGPSTAVST